MTNIIKSVTGDKNWILPKLKKIKLSFCNYEEVSDVAAQWPSPQTFYIHGEGGIHRVFVDSIKGLLDGQLFDDYAEEENILIAEGKFKAIFSKLGYLEHFRVFLYSNEGFIFLDLNGKEQRWYVWYEHEVMFDGEGVTGSLTKKEKKEYPRLPGSNGYVFYMERNWYLEN